MRPRGDTQRRYNEAIQSLSGKKLEKPTTSVSNKIIMKKSPLNLVERRTACPQTVVKLWAGMHFIRQQKQISNLTRLAIYMKRKHNMSTEDVDNALKDAVKDGLILSKTVVGCKGSKVGVEQEGYRVPQSQPESDGHDWYCFVCHQGGEMALCSTCHRVFHEDCIDYPPNSSTFICDVCKPQEEKFQVTLAKKELNELLHHTCVRLKEKTRELHRIPNPNEDKEKHDLFVYCPMDLCTMEHKVKKNKYTTLMEFFNDALQVVHDVIIFYGEITRNAALARQMIRDCEYDLREIEQCPNCYRCSNQKHIESEWFCKPCHPPHELVFAKTKGYPYWPAKVLRIAKENGAKTYYVRFFGARHYRASVNEDSVKPIATTLQEMGLKKSVPSLARALSELAKHQSLVKKQAHDGANKTPVNGKRKLDDIITIGDSPDRSSLSDCTPLENSGTVGVRKRRPGRPPKKQETVSTGKIKNKDIEIIEIKERKSRSLTKERVVIRRQIRRNVIRQDIKPTETKVKRTVCDSQSRESSIGTPISKRRKVQRELFEKSIDSPKKDTSSINIKDGQVEEQNVVSSSQEITVTFSTVATQTEPYVFNDAEIDEIQKDQPSKLEKAEKVPCNCAIEYSDMIKKIKEKLEKEHEESKEKALKELTEKLKAEMETEKQKIIQRNEEECLKYRQKMALLRQRAEDEMRESHEAEIQRFKEQHQAEISVTKKKQWCYNCEKEAIYHCCWNTAYCTVECQQVHWHDGHKKTCRRPRNR